MMIQPCDGNFQDAFVSLSRKNKEKAKKEIPIPDNVDFKPKTLNMVRELIYNGASPHKICKMI